MFISASVREFDYIEQVSRVLSLKSAPRQKMGSRDPAHRFSPAPPSGAIRRPLSAQRWTFWDCLRSATAQMNRSPTEQLPLRTRSQPHLRLARVWGTSNVHSPTRKRI